MEPHVGIAITILDSDNHVIDYGNAGTISLEMFVGSFRIILFCLDELMVEIKVILATLCQLSCCQQCFQEQII